MYAEEEDDVGDDRNQNVFSCDFHWIIPPPFRSADYTLNERGAWHPDEAFRPLRPGLWFAADSPLDGKDSNSRSPSKGDPASAIIRSAAAPLVGAKKQHSCREGPVVRILLPPAESLRTIGSATISLHGSLLTQIGSAGEGPDALCVGSLSVRLFGWREPTRRHWPIPQGHCRLGCRDGRHQPGDLEAQIESFVADYNHRRYHESIDNLTPADVYCGRGRAILAERERIKRQTIANRRLQHQLQAA